MRKCFFAALLLLGSAFASLAQPHLPIDALYGAQESFSKKASSDGEGPAFISALTDDGIIFRPAPTKGLHFWKDNSDAQPTTMLDRRISFADVSSNGLMGYTTGMWKSSQKANGKPVERAGEYVTIWERRNGEGFKAVLDITTRHDDFDSIRSNGGGRAAVQDANSRGWSATNDAYKFLRTSMQGGGLAAALNAVTMDDVRLLIDDEPPIVGKKKVSEAARLYTAMGFPESVAIYQSGDMAYFWNQCRYQNSSEGVERGNCLQIMKLREKKWWIVLAVFSRLDDAKPPVLVSGSHRKK